MYLCNVKNIKIMKINLERIKSGMAGGKQIVVVDGYGSFQPTYVQLYALGMSVMYISHSKKNADIKLCLTLQDVANHLGCDCDEMVNKLPKGWDKERTNNFGLYSS